MSSLKKKNFFFHLVDFRSCFKSIFKMILCDQMYKSSKTSLSIRFHPNLVYFRWQLCNHLQGTDAKFNVGGNWLNLQNWVLKTKFTFYLVLLTLFSVLYNLIHSGFRTLTFNKFMEKLTILACRKYFFMNKGCHVQKNNVSDYQVQSRVFWWWIVGCLLTIYAETLT